MSSSSTGETPADSAPRCFNVQIQTEIGRGGFATVFKGLWEDIPIAAKFVHGDSNGTVGGTDEFNRESKVLHNLRHPNIITFYGIYTDEKERHLYMIMEYADRGSLRSILDKQGSGLPFDKALRYALQISRAMRYLHEETRLCVHGDLKSDNILLSQENVKLTDFGLCRNYRRIDAPVGSPDFVGTVSYAPPECLGVHKNMYFYFGEKSDVYSFGVLFAEMITGEYPFEVFQNPEAISRAIVKGTRLRLHRDLDTNTFYLIGLCWSQIYSDRPLFSDIVQFLTSIRANLSDRSLPIEIPQAIKRNLQFIHEPDSLRLNYMDKNYLGNLLRLKGLIDVADRLDHMGLSNYANSLRDDASVNSPEGKQIIDEIRNRFMPLLHYVHNPLTNIAKQLDDKIGEQMKTDQILTTGGLKHRSSTNHPNLFLNAGSSADEPMKKVAEELTPTPFQQIPDPKYMTYWPPTQPTDFTGPRYQNIYARRGSDIPQIQNLQHLRYYDNSVSSSAPSAGFLYPGSHAPYDPTNTLFTQQQPQYPQPSAVVYSQQQYSPVDLALYPQQQQQQQQQQQYLTPSYNSYQNTMADSTLHQQQHQQQQQQYMSSTHTPYQGAIVSSTLQQQQQPSSSTHTQQYTPVDLVPHHHQQQQQQQQYLATSHTPYQSPNVDSTLQQQQQQRRDYGLSQPIARVANMEHKSNSPAQQNQILLLTPTDPSSSASHHHSNPRCSEVLLQSLCHILEGQYRQAWLALETRMDRIELVVLGNAAKLLVVELSPELTPPGPTIYPRRLRHETKQQLERAKTGPLVDASIFLSFIHTHPKCQVLERLFCVVCYYGKVYFGVKFTYDANSESFDALSRIDKKLWSYTLPAKWSSEKHDYQQISEEARQCLSDFGGSANECIPFVRFMEALFLLENEDTLILFSSQGIGTGTNRGVIILQELAEQKYVLAIRLLVQLSHGVSHGRSLPGGEFIKLLARGRNLGDPHCAQLLDRILSQDAN